MKPDRLIPVLFIAAAGLPCAAQPVPTVTEFVTASRAFCISGDGTIVGGEGSYSGPARPVIWTRQAGLQFYPVLPGGNKGQVRDLSYDGSVGVGQTNTPTAVFRAVRWSQGNPTDLGTFNPSPSSTSEAFGVSRDGQVVVGHTQGVGTLPAFRWTEAGGLENLGFYTSATEYSAWGRATNADGSVVFGYGHASQNGQMIFPVAPFRWEGGAIQSIGGPPPGWLHALAYDATPDGTTVVGRLNSFGPEFYWDGFRWSAATGFQEIAFLLPGAANGHVNACSADGKTIVGENIFSPPTGNYQRGTIWTEQHGVRDMHETLTAMGVMPAGRVLESITGISEDGTVMVGWTNGPGFHRGVVIDFRNDTDGDGLLDHWEINGIPYVNDLGQERRVQLPGANPARKDLYVEIDAMLGIGFNPDAIPLLEQAFAQAPLPNPDGSTGITLHVMVDESDLNHIPVWQTNGCWPQGYNSYYDAHFGTAADRAANGGGGFLYRSARAKAFRYCIVADAANPEIGGCGEIPGDQMVLFLGWTYDELAHASVFMHELGHCLGLNHGGHDAINGKPNYPSIMNYTLAYRAPWNESFWRLDYSREGGLLLGHLNESDLDETRGIGYANSVYADFLMPIGINDATGRTISFVALDGSQQDYGDTAGTGIPDGNFTTGVVQDLNFLPAPPPGIALPTAASPGEMLQAHNDWAAIVLATPEAIGSTAPVPVFPEGELTVSAINWMAQNFPIPGGGPICYANCDGSTAAPVLNVSDFGCFLTKFAAGDPYANCDGSTGAPQLNVADFSCFLQAFAAGCP